MALLALEHIDVFGLGYYRCSDNHLGFWFIVTALAGRHQPAKAVTMNQSFS